MKDLPEYNPNRVLELTLKIMEARSGYDRRQILGTARPEPLITARHMTYWLLNKAGLSINRITTLINKNRSTLRHGIEKLEACGKAYPEHAIQMEQAWSSLKEDLEEDTKLNSKAHLRAVIYHARELLDQITPENLPHKKANVRCMLSGILEA